MKVPPPVSNTASDFETYVHARWARLVRVGYMLGCSPEQAEDLAQDTLTRAYERWAKISVVGDPDAYLFRMLINGQARSRRQRWWGEIPGEPPAEVEEGSGSTVEESVDIRNALQQLPFEQRSVLVLRFLEDQSEECTAAALNLPLKTVKSRSSRGLKARPFVTNFPALYLGHRRVDRWHHDRE